MPQDWFNLRHVAQELQQLQGAKINRITQANKDEVIFYTYKNTVKKLIVSANASLCRISFTDAERENPAVAYNFCMLLRKHLSSGVITDVEIVEYERIIKITVVSRDELLNQSEKVLYCEIMGKYSNLILTENGKVLGAMHTANNDISCVRPLIIGMEYKIPPMQDKMLPKEKPFKDLMLDYISDGYVDKNGGEYVFKNFIGFAYPTAEAIWQTIVTALNKGESKKDAVNKGFDFIYSDSIQPTIYYEDGKPIDYSAVNYGYGESYNTTLSEVIDGLYNYKENASRIREKKNKLLSGVNGAIKRNGKKMQLISEKEEECKNAEENKLFGELILTYAYMIKGGESVDLYDYVSNKTVRIKLDKSLTATENAALYFKRYKKEKRTMEAVAVQKKEVAELLNYYKTLVSEIELAEDLSDLNAIEEELKEEGLIKNTTVKKNKNSITSSRIYNIDGFIVKVGRNNIENDRITEKANKNDLWLHVKEYHSAHVLICADNKAVPPSVLKTGAEICAYYSKCRYGSKTEVDYTKRKNLKKPPKSKPGTFLYTDYNTIIVNPDAHRELLVSDIK